MSNHEEGTVHDEGKMPNNKEVSMDDQEIYELYKIAEKARMHQRLRSNEMQQIILGLCESRYLSSREIAMIMNRKLERIYRYLRELVNEDKLVLRYPSSLNSKYQDY